jgi:hypothetical protein
MQAMQNRLIRDDDTHSRFYGVLTKKYNNTFRKSLRVKSKLIEMPEMPTSLAIFPQRPGRVAAFFGIAPSRPRTLLP